MFFFLYKTNYLTCTSICIYMYCSEHECNGEKIIQLKYRIEIASNVCVHMNESHTNNLKRGENVTKK